MRRAGPRFEDITSFAALCAAARRAARGLSQRPAVARFLADMEPEVFALQRELLGGDYRPRPLRRFQIRDPKPRTISVAAFRDRVVHHALCDGLLPLFERYADPDSFACRVGRGNLAAVRRLQVHERRHPWFVKLDVRHFFETVDHAVLLGLLGRLIRDARVLGLTRALLEAGANRPGVGLPIGNLTSQQFGNLLLGRLDHHNREVLRVPAMVRYMDDLALLGPDRDAVRTLRDAATVFLGETLHLEVKAEATVLGPVDAGVPFLGFRVWPQHVRLDPARARRFWRHWSAIEAACAENPEDAAVVRRAESLFSWAEQANTHLFRRALLDGH